MGYVFLMECQLQYIRQHRVMVVGPPVDIQLRFKRQPDEPDTGTFMVHIGIREDGNAPPFSDQCNNGGAEFGMDVYIRRYAKGIEHLPDDFAVTGSSPEIPKVVMTRFISLPGSLY